MHRPYSSYLFYTIFPVRCIICNQVLLGKKVPVQNICSSCLRRIFREQLGRNTCSVCGRSLISEMGVCMYCRRRSFHFCTHISLFEYEGSIKLLMKKYKFSGYRQIAWIWAAVIHGYLRDHAVCVPVVPVPGRKKSIRKRGWDQVELVASLLEHRYHHSVMRLLRRSSGKSQKVLSYEERMTNMKGQIMVKGKEKPEKVLLLDDIFTTGATLDECARVLINYGVKHADALTIARTPIV